MERPCNIKKRAAAWVKITKQKSVYLFQMKVIIRLESVGWDGVGWWERNLDRWAWQMVIWRWKNLVETVVTNEFEKGPEKSFWSLTQIILRGHNWDENEQTAQKCEDYEKKDVVNRFNSWKVTNVTEKNEAWSKRMSEGSMITRLIAKFNQHNPKLDTNWLSLARWIHAM